MELVTYSMSESTHLITKVMKGESLRKIYGEKIRLTPTMEREKASQIKQKISGCRTQHSHTLNILTNKYRKGIELLDSTLNNSCLTPREIVLAQHYKDGSKRLLVLVNRNTYNVNINFTLPKNTAGRITTAW